MPTDEPGGNYFVQGYKDIWNMGTDLGNEFPDGDLLSDVLLRIAGKTDFQNYFQREENFIRLLKSWIRDCPAFLHVGRILCYTDK